MLSHLLAKSKETKLIERDAGGGGWRSWVKMIKGTASSYKIKSFRGWNVQHENSMYVTYCITYLKAPSTIPAVWATIYSCFFLSWDKPTS